MNLSNYGDIALIITVEERLEEEIPRFSKDRWVAARAQSFNLEWASPEHYKHCKGWKGFKTGEADNLAGDSL